MKENNLKETNDKKEVETSTATVRTGETKYVVARRKPSIFLSIILILIGAVLAALIMLICFGDKIVSNNVEDEGEAPETEVVQEDKEEKVKEVRILNLDPKGDFITLLYTKLTTNNVNSPIVYAEGTTDYNSFDDNERVLFTLRDMKWTYGTYDQYKDKLDNKIPVNQDDIRYISEIRIYSVEDVEAKYKSIYGADKSLPLIDVETHMGYVYEYVKEDGKFYGHSYPGGGGSSFRYDRKITKVDRNEEGTEVYIYDSFACANQGGSSPEGNRWGFFASADQKRVIKENVLEVYENSVSKFEGKTMEVYLKDLVNENKYQYKHTFKVDKAGNYYWASTEPVK